MKTLQYLMAGKWHFAMTEVLPSWDAEHVTLCGVSDEVAAEGQDAPDRLEEWTKGECIVDCVVCLQRKSEALRREAFESGVITTDEAVSPISHYRKLRSLLSTH